jgi:chromosome segregation ATPase
MTDWVAQLRVLVDQRNRGQTHGFVDLVASHNFLVKQNIELQSNNTEIKKQVIILQHSSGSSEEAENVTQLRSELHSAQRDLTAKYRAEADAATEALSLTAKNKKLEDTAVTVEAEFAECKQELAAAHRIEAEQQASITQRDADLLLVKQELQRVRDLYEASEKEVGTCNATNRELVQRLVEEKNKVAAEMNQMNHLLEELHVRETKEADQNAMLSTSMHINDDYAS